MIRGIPLFIYLNNEIVELAAEVVDSSVDGAQPAEGLGQLARAVH